MPLGPAEVRGITHLGGTILGTTNRGNPFRYVTRDADGRDCELDRSDDLVAAFQASGFDALVSIGGDGSLQISHDLWQKGLPVVCVPKTIDNDVSGTQRTFGFDTAVSTATEAIDRLHSTAESHERVMVVELMGRYAGWIALYSGLSGSADVILHSRDSVRHREGVREDPEPRGGGPALQHRGRGGGRAAEGRRRSSWSSGAASAPWTGSAASASKVARAIERHTGKETRTLVLGHLQRGGSPTTYDRLLALRFGAAAVRAIADRALRHHGRAQRPGHHAACRWRTSSAAPKNVPLDSDTIRTARDLGISLGD